MKKLQLFENDTREGNFGSQLSIGDEIVTRLVWEQGNKSAEHSGKIMEFGKDDYGHPAALLQLDNGKMMVQPLSNIWKEADRPSGY